MEETYYRATFLLKGAHESLSFAVGSPNTEVVEDFFNKFLMVFPGVLDVENKRIIAFTENSDELQANIRNFAKRYPEIPKLKAVEAFIRRLEDGEKFFALPNTIPSQSLTTKLRNYLESGQDLLEFDKLNALTDELFGELMLSYKIESFGEERLVIGATTREQKICRFCKKRYPEVTFDKKAHAISEGLGNKTLVLTEECDSCNTKFSQTLEPDLIAFFSMYRTLYGIRGKGGEKEFKGKNFKLFKAETLELHFFVQEEESVGERRHFPNVIKLDSGRKIRMQNIYKCFVKFVLSVIDKSELANFEKTLKWLNGEIELAQLPKIAIHSSFEQLNQQPILTLFTRIADDERSPYLIGEFHFAVMRYIFIVPGSAKDSIEFLTSEEYDHFFKKFKMYNILENSVAFRDFSDNKERLFDIKINFNSPNPPEE